MQYLITKHKTIWLDKSFALLALLSLVYFVFSFFINYKAISFATSAMGNATTDILLDNLPIINTDIIFSQGALVFTFFTAIILVLNPKTIPFTLKTIALFICVRALFIIMTHLGPIPGSIHTDLGNLKYFSADGDLFFSGHTGLPFLLSLIFWDNKILRYTYITCSVIAGLSVLLGHLHYTIDVFSAFFISFGIYHLALKFFPRDHKYFDLND